MANEIALREQVALVPALISRAGGNARFAYDEFFRATISNPHTRRAYARTVDRFLSWCEERKLELHNITPGLAGDYINGLEASTPTKNQALAALRHFFDGMVTRHVVPLNSFHSVRRRSTASSKARRPRSALRRRALFAAVDTSNVVGLRDRAVLGVLAYTGARVGAVAKLRISDLRDLGETRARAALPRKGRQGTGDPGAP